MAKESQLSIVDAEMYGDGLMDAKAEFSAKLPVTGAPYKEQAGRAGDGTMDYRHGMSKTVEQTGLRTSLFLKCTIRAPKEER